MEKNEDKSIRLGVLSDEDFEIFKSKLAEGLDSSNDVQNIHEIATILHSRAQYYLMTGQTDNAEEYFQKAAEAYRKTSDEDSLAFCLSQYALILRHYSKRESAEKSLVEAVKLGKNLGLKRKDIKNWFLKPYFLNLLEIFKAPSEARMLKKKLEQAWLQDVI